MPFATVILAHKHPQQVARLVERLSPNPVFLHVDSAVPEPAARRFAALAEQDGVHLLERRRTAWASWQLVEAALDGAATALEHPGWSHVQVLSGQDYPLRPAAGIEAFLAEHRDRSFVASWPLPSPMWGRHGGLDRTRDRNFAVAGRRVRIRWRRRVPGGLRLVGGSMYWQLTPAAATALVETLRARPDWRRFLRGSWIPDELAVPSVLSSVRPSLPLVNENLTFIRWSDPAGAHPDVLTADDADELLAAADGPASQGGVARAKLFARKFDIDRDARILDRIDDDLLRSPAAGELR
jgi:hypothetical protein